MITSDHVIDHVAQSPTCFALNGAHGHIYAIANAQQISIYRTNQASSRCVQAIAFTSSSTSSTSSSISSSLISSDIDSAHQIAALRFHSASRLSNDQSFNAAHSDTLAACNGSNLFVYDLSSQSHPLTRVIDAVGSSNGRLAQRIDEFSWSSCHPDQLATIGAHRSSTPVIYDTRQHDAAMHMIQETQLNDISHHIESDINSSIVNATIPAISSVLIAYHPSLSHLLACVHHNLVQVFDLRMIRSTSINSSSKHSSTGPMKSFCSPLSSAIQSLDWNPFDDRELMTGNIAQQLQFWHLDSQEPINRCQYSIQSLHQTDNHITQQTMNSTLRAAVFTPWKNGLISLSSTNDANIRVWRFGTERGSTLPNGHAAESNWFNAECIDVLDGGDSTVIGLDVLRQAALSPPATRSSNVTLNQSITCRQQIWALGDDKRIRIWDVRDEWIKACDTHYTSNIVLDDFDMLFDSKPARDMNPSSVHAINDELKQCASMLSNFHLTPIDSVSRTSQLTLSLTTSNVPAIKLYVKFPSTYPSHASPCFILDTESPSLLRRSGNAIQTDILHELSHLAYEHTVNHIDQPPQNQSGCLLKCLSRLHDISDELFSVEAQRVDATLNDSPLLNSTISPPFEPAHPSHTRKTVRINERALSLSFAGRRGIASASTPALSSLMSRTGEYSATSSQSMIHSNQEARTSSSLSCTPDYIQEDEEDDSFDDQLMSTSHLTSDGHIRRTQSNPLIKPADTLDDTQTQSMSSDIIIQRSKQIESALNEQLPCPSLMCCCWGPHGQLIVLNQPILQGSHASSARPANYAQFLGMRHIGSRSVHSTPIKSSNSSRKREYEPVSLNASSASLNQSLDFDAVENEHNDVNTEQDLRISSESDSDDDADLIHLDEVPLSALDSINSSHHTNSRHTRTSSIGIVTNNVHHVHDDISTSLSRSLHHNMAHLDANTDVPYQIHPRERERALQQSIRHSLLMVDMSCLFAVDLSLAAEYSMNATSPLELALNNQMRAVEHGRNDLARVWHLVALIIEADRSINQSLTQPKQLPFASLSPWSSSQFGGALATQLMSDLFRTGDFQSVGLIACALQIHENQVKHRTINYSMKQQQQSNQSIGHPPFSLTPSHSEPVLTLLAPVISSRSITQLPSSLYNDRLTRHSAMKRPASTPSVSNSSLNASAQPAIATLITSMRRSASGNAASGAISDYSASSRDERSPRFIEAGSVPTPTNMRYMRPRQHSPNTFSEAPSPQPATPLSPVSIGPAELTDSAFISVRVSRTDLYKLCYAEFLHRAGLYVFRAWVLKLLSPALLADEASTSSLIGYTPFQSTVGFSCTCEHCGSQSSSLSCQVCSRLVAMCAVCDSTVQGHAMYCQKCGHGGHIAHLQHWFSSTMECPRGCGCRCSF